MNELLGRILELLRDAWRFRWRALVVAWVLAIVGWLVVYGLPNQYEVEARVHIDTESAIQPLLRGLTVTPDLRQQVNFLIQTVLSQPNLKDIARRTGLDVKATTPEAEEALLSRLENGIQIRSTGGRTNLFTISFVSSDAETARAVVQQVIQIMERMALGNSGDDSAQATDFLEREVERSRKEVAKLEEDLTAFKKENAAVIPGRGGYVGRVQTLQADLDRLNDRLSAAENRRDLLRQQLQSAGGGGSRTISPEQSQQVRALDAQISERRGQLERMLAQYTEEYPDVSTLRRDIARLEDRRAETVARLRANPERVTVGDGGVGGLLRQQVADAEVEINTVKAAIQRKNNRIEDLKGGADEITGVQSQLEKLTRTYESAQEKYSELSDRLYTARLSDEVERSGNRLKFRLIDPPELPSEPTGPQRTILMTVVLIGGLLGGAAFAFFMSQIRPVFINRRALTDATGLPVLGAVSMAWTTGQHVQRRTALLLFFVGVGTLVVGYLGAVALAPVGVRFVPTFLSNQWL